MKTLWIVFFLGLMSHFSAFAQSAKDIFEKREIVFLGIDFSQARFIGSGEFLNHYEIKNKYIPAWNNLILKERDKYDVKKYFRMDDVEHEFDVVRALHDDIDVEEKVINSDHELSEEDIQKAVKEYNFNADNVDTDKKIGLVFIAEYLMKFKEDEDIEPIGSYWVTFFDTESRKVLLTERMKGEPGGFGFRNYWARTYYNVMQNAKEKVKEWDREYD
jgi:hypothetical protein